MDAAAASARRQLDHHVNRDDDDDDDESPIPCEYTNTQLSTPEDHFSNSVIGLRGSTCQRSASPPPSSVGYKVNEDKNNPRRKAAKTVLCDGRASAACHRTNRRDIRKIVDPKRKSLKEETRTVRQTH